MARGITESDVHTAADEIVAAGERPTVERIRAALGTGSPNTVVRHLDSWWQGLGSRLHVAGERTALPMVPQDLTQLANQWWETALIAARGAALQTLAQEHAALAQARQQFEDEVQAQAGQVRDAYATAANATHALELAQTQVHDGKRLAQQQASQLADLARQRDALQSRLEQVEQGSVALTHQLEQQARDAAQERERQGVYVQAVEDRANTEIDRARQELRELRTQHSAAHRQQSALENQLRGERDKALEQAALMHRELAVVRGQAENLEKQVQTLGNLPQVLQAALSSARTKPRGKTTSARPRAVPQKSTT